MTTSFYRFALLGLVFLTLYFSRVVVLTALIAVGIGVIVSPILDYFKNRFKLRRAFGALLFLSVLMILLLGVIGMFGLVVTEQINTLAQNMPDYNVKLRSIFTSVFERFPWAKEQISNFDFATAVRETLSVVYQGAEASVVAISGVVLAFIIGIYLAVDKILYFQGTVRIFPVRYRVRAEELLVKCARVLRVWFRAQLIDMAIIGLITTVGLWVVGISYWALFGLLTALFGIIPYVGVMIVVALTTLITLATDVSQVPWVLLVFFITQQIEGNIVLPLVMKGQAEIPEALLMIVMLFFGFWFGLLGVFVAPPFVAVMICLYRNLYLPYIEGDLKRQLITEGAKN